MKTNKLNNKAIRNILVLILSLFIILSNIPVIGQAATKPSAPTVYTTTNSSGAVKIIWSKVEGVDGYEIWRSVNGAEYTKLLVKKDGSITSFVNSSANDSNTTYKYKVKSFIGSKESDRVYSDFSNEAIRFASMQDSVSVSNYTAGIKLTWSGFADADGYIVYCEDYEGNTRTVNKAGATNTSFYDSKNMVDGKIYKYKVVAYKTINKTKRYGADMSWKSYTRFSALRPPAPTVYTTTNSSGAVKVNWNEIEGVNGYEIWRSVNGAEYTKLLVKKDGSITSFVNSSANDNNNTYKYKIKSFVGKEESNRVYSYFSNEAIRFASMQDNITISNYSSGIKLTWDEVAGADGYTVYCEDYEGNTRTVNKSGATSTTFYDSKNMVNGEIYKYKVVAYQKINGIKRYGADMPWQSYMRLVQPAITNIEITSTGLKVTWERNPSATGYYVYRSQNDGEYKKIIIKTGADTTSFVNISPIKGNDYSYKVVAYNDTYKSSDSAGESMVKSVCYHDFQDCYNVEKYDCYICMDCGERIIGSSILEENTRAAQLAAFFAHCDQTKCGGAYMLGKVNIITSIISKCSNCEIASGSVMPTFMRENKNYIVWCPEYGYIN